MKASCLCHTDLHAWYGDCPVKPAPPSVTGRDVIGLVERGGAGVLKDRIGQQVAIAWLGSGRRCEFLISGRWYGAERLLLGHRADLRDSTPGR
jgi:propanol-preferring alcohol dehydrogenase